MAVTNVGEHETGDASTQPIMSQHNYAIAPGVTGESGTRQRTGNRLKLLIWSVIPTHHQSAFFAALRQSGVDVIVHYYNRLEGLSDRLRLGWDNPASLPAGEYYVPPTRAALDRCADWRDRIHIVPGYGSLFLLRLALTLSREQVPWVHWGEPSRPTSKSVLAYAIKRFYYGWLVDHYATGAFAIGECAERDFVRLGVRPERIRFLPYAVPPVDLPANPGNEVGAEESSPPLLRFLFVGALCHRKGIDVLLRAFKKVATDYPDVQLDLVGSDESGGEYRTLTSRLELTEVVRMTSSVPASQIGVVYAHCDVFVLPSRFDGWGVVLNEAASAGKPLISTEATGSAHHLIVPGMNGFRVPAADPAALAEAMLSYCRNPALIAIHGRQSRRLFAGFTPEQNALRLQQGLRSLLDRQDRRPSSKAWSHKSAAETDDG